VQAQRGQRAAALQSARQALQADPKAASAGQLAIELIEPQRGPADELVQAHLQALPAREAANVRVALARALVERDRSDEAEAQLQQAIDADPQLADAWLLHGLLLAQRQARELAQRALQQYLALTEANADAAARGRTQALLELADLATAAGQLDEAQRWLDRIRDGDALLSVQIRRAQQLALRGQLDAARNLLRDTPTNNADERLRLLIAEARLLRDHDQAQTAYELLQQAHAQQPGQRELQYELAMMAERVGALAQMEQLLRELIARFPEDAQAYNALGYALADRGLRLDEAKALIEQALQRAPNDAYIIDSLGWVEYRLGNLARARELLQDAMRRRPDPEIAAHLGEVLWTMGEREQAVRVWRQGLALDARHRVLLDTMARHGVRP
jgi:tetratricopeptide (TPR) repeat protein